MTTERNKIDRERLARQMVLCNGVVDNFGALMSAEQDAREALQATRRATAAALPKSAWEILSQPATDLAHLVPDLPAHIDELDEQQQRAWRATRRNLAALIDKLAAAERTVQLTREAMEAARPRYRALIAYRDRLEKFAKEHNL